MWQGGREVRVHKSESRGGGWWLVIDTLMSSSKTVINTNTQVSKNEHGLF